MLLYMCKVSLIYVESSHSLCQNDAKFQNHSPSILQVKTPHLQKIDAYNFIYKINFANLMKLFFLSHKCIKKVHKLVHKQIHYTAPNAHITYMPFLVPTFINCKWFKEYQFEVLRTSFYDFWRISKQYFSCVAAWGGV